MRLAYKREPEGTHILINGKLWGIARMTGRRFEWEVLQKKTANSSYLPR